MYTYISIEAWQLQCAQIIMFGVLGHIVKVGDSGRKGGMRSYEEREDGICCAEWESPWRAANGGEEMDRRCRGLAGGRGL